MTTFTTEDINGLKTEWFPFSINPVYNGEYEVTSTSWPWTFRAMWDNECGWGDVDKVTITHWRGLKEKI